MSLHETTVPFEPGSKRFARVASRSVLWPPFLGAWLVTVATKLEAILVAPAARCPHPASAFRPLTDLIMPP